MKLSCIWLCFQGFGSNGLPYLNRIRDDFSEGSVVLGRCGLTSGWFKQHALCGPCPGTFHSPEDRPDPHAVAGRDLHGRSGGVQALGDQLVEPGHGSEVGHSHQFPLPLHLAHGEDTVPEGAREAGRPVVLAPAVGN